MMMKVAVLLGPDFEDAEFTEPVTALREAGHEVEVLGRQSGETLAGKHGTIQIDVAACVSDRDPEAYDGLLIPGGHAPDTLRIHEGMVDFVRRFDQLRRPLAAVCHGPQLLIEADVVRGRTLTSWPSVRTDLRNAGAEVVDQEVCIHEHLITARKQDDLDAFSKALLEALPGG